MSRVRPLWRSLVDAAVFLALCFLVMLALQIYNGEKIDQGSVTVIDGDSLREGKTEIRLYGIDAPEYRQTCSDQNGVSYACGKRAADELRQLLRTGQTTCKSFEIDRYGRSVATCQSGALNLNSEMVRRGWAVAFVQFGVDYVLIEKEARAAKRGLWAGKFEEPATYRKRMRPMQSDATGVNDWQPD